MTISTLDGSVWLRKRMRQMRPNRRDVARSTRHRWLQSVHRDGVTWDALEATPGMPLSAIVKSDELKAREGIEWKSTRHWLHDLTLEMASADQDETLPSPLSPAHVWITTEGHAVLLDHAHPDAIATGDDRLVESFDVSTIRGQQRFIAAIAAFTRPASVPLAARRVLENLDNASFDRLTFLAGNLRSLLTKSARIDRGTRTTALLTVPLFLIAISVISDQAARQSYRTAAQRWSHAHPNLPPLSEVLRFRRSIRSEVGSGTLNTHLAGNYRSLLDDLEFRDDRAEIVATLGDPRAEDFMRRALRTTERHTPGEVAIADRQVATSMRRLQQRTHLVRPLSGLRFLTFVLVTIGLVQLPALVFFARTIGQIIFGYAVVDRDGHPAGRGRVLMRWAIVWIPIAATLSLSFLSPSAYVILAPWMAGLIAAIRNPSRGWQERWTGTWLVPR